MAHTCENCGERFETLSSLRLHDCPSEDDSTDEGMIGSDGLEDRGRKRRRERERMAARVIDEEFEEVLERARTPDPAAAVTALAQYEHELEAALERNDGGESYRAVFWTYYQPVVELIDAVTKEDGWPFILDVTGAYDHREEGKLSNVTAVVANAVARSVIRTRLAEGVAAIPVEALTYLGSIPTFDDGSFEGAWEESQHVGWAIGHPEYSLEETIFEVVEDDDIWAGAATFRALHADQEAAAPLYAEVIRRADDVGFVLDRLAHLEGIPDWSVFPRGWDVDAEFDRDFTLSLEESTENELREAITEIGYDEHLSEDWTLEDLELRWG